MRLVILTTRLMLPALVIGCSSEAPPTATTKARTLNTASVGLVTAKETKAAPAAAPLAAATSTESKVANADSQVASLSTTDSQPKGNADFIAPFDTKRDLFKPPPAPVIPQKVPEPQISGSTSAIPIVPVVEEEAPAPSVRLVGFSEVEGLKAMVSIDGKPFLIEEGETVRDVTLVSIAPPAIDLKFQDQEWTVELFKQPMKNAPTSIGPVYSSQHARSPAPAHRASPSPGRKGPSSHPNASFTGFRPPVAPPPDPAGSDKSSGKAKSKRNNDSTADREQDRPTTPNLLRPNSDPAAGAGPTGGRLPGMSGLPGAIFSPSGLAPGQ